MATVATGTPPGIWTVDSSESRPPSALVSMGTPMTGSGELPAIAPARCAAPPAPAMRTRRPRSCAVRAYCATSSGVRCADMTRVSQATPNSVQASAASFIVGQSESLPITMPTTAFLIVAMIVVSSLRGTVTQRLQNAF